MIVFKRKETLDATEEILTDNGIRQPYSKDIAPIWNRQAGNQCYSSGQLEALRTQLIARSPAAQTPNPTSPSSIVTPKMAKAAVKPRSNKSNSELA
jgi:hypothetical protein